jgi:hypothetical protein
MILLKHADVRAPVGAHPGLFHSSWRMTMTRAKGAGGTVYLVAVAAVLVWGVLGIIDMPNSGYTGYTTTAQNVVSQVDPGSPAEAGGVMVGDRVTSVNGIAIEDTRARNRAPRLVPGSPRELGLDRAGQPVSVSLTASAAPGGERALAWSAIVLGLLFLGLPLWARSKSGTRASGILAWFGVCFGLSFLPGPWLSSVTLRSLAGAVTLTAIVIGFALLLHFILAFPRESPFLSKRSAKLWIFGPAGVVALMFIFVILTEAAETSGLNAIINLIVVALIVGYFGASLFVLLRQYRSATPAERRSTGLSLMLWGAAAAMVPLVLLVLLELVAPLLVVPGQDFYFLLLGLIPIAFSLAVIRTARTGRESRVEATV